MYNLKTKTTMKKILLLSAFGMFGALAGVNAQTTTPAKASTDKEVVATEAAIPTPADEVEAPAKIKSCCSSKTSARKASGCGSADKAHAHASDAKTGKSCCASKGKAEARLNDDGSEEAENPSVH